MKLTRQQVLELYGVLNAIGQKDMVSKGAYAVSKNKRIAETEVKIVEEIRNSFKIPEGIHKFNDERLELCKSFANKDESGEPKVIDSRFDISEEKKDEFETAISNLRENYKEDFDKQEQTNKEFQELLEEEIEIDFHMTKLEHLPEKVTGHQMEVLMDIIIDEG
jgi:hypothetical protein